MERSEFVFQAFEHHIDTGRKHTVVAGGQPSRTFNENFDGCQRMHPVLDGAGCSSQLATACINVEILIVAKLEKVSETA